MARPGSRLVTVFGGSGFVGAQTVRALARDGWRVRVAVRNPTLAFELRPQGGVGQIQLMACDVSDDNQVAAALEGADAAINLVGVLYETPWRSFAAVHTEAAERIARACARQGVSRFIQMSALGADQASPAAYARSKALGELAAREAFAATTVIRPSVIFGRGDQFLNRFAAMASFAPALPLPGGGETKFQPVYVGDVAQAILNALTDPAAAGRTYELGGPETLTFRDILEFIMAETHRKRGLIPLPWPVASLIGMVSEPLGWVGLNPPLTRDQVEMLKTDNVVSDGAFGLAELGVTRPTSLEAVAPSYLWRYRRGGQFADMAAA